MTKLTPTRRAHRLAARAAAAFGAGATLLGAAGATGMLNSSTAAASTMAPVTVAGKVTKVTSTSSFTMVVGAKRYAVKVDAMTHVRDNGMTVAFKTLTAGDDVTVKGPVEMGEITATSVVITAM